MVQRRRWLGSVLGAIALGLFGCDGGKTDGGGIKPEESGKPATSSAAEWKVGAFLSLSGEDTAFGTDTKEGIELAVDEVNKAGGARGKPIKVLYEDDKSQPAEANNKVLQLIDRDKVVAILGEVASSRTRAGGIVANRKHVPLITPSSTHPDITKIGPFVFRVCFTDDEQGQLGAKFAVNKLGKKKVAVLFASDDLYSSGLANEFKTELKKLGGEVVVEKGFLKKETNFTTYLNEIKAAKPDIVYAPIYYNAMTLIARQAKAADIKGDMFLGGDGWDASELLRDAGDELEGAFFTNHYAPDMPGENAKAFLAKYKGRYSRDPTSLAAMGYDAARLLADAIGRAKGDTPDALRQAIQDTKGFQGATGTITINADRNADKPIVIVRIKGKKYTYYDAVGSKGEAPAASGAPSAAPAASGAPSATPAASGAPSAAPAAGQKK
jgi:branched-chain amino acid transport system substrate-binding protein